MLGLKLDHANKSGILINVCCSRHILYFILCLDFAILITGLNATIKSYTWLSWVSKGKGNDLLSGQDQDIILTHDDFLQYTHVNFES